MSSPLVLLNIVGLLLLVGLLFHIILTERETEIYNGTIEKQTVEA